MHDETPQLIGAEFRAKLEGKSKKPLSPIEQDKLIVRLGVPHVHTPEGVKVLRNRADRRAAGIRRQKR